MTTTFDERERAAERGFVLEEEARFHARNRRNRLLAAWACERMQLTGQAGDGYVDAFTEGGVVTDDATLIKRLHTDLKAAGIDATVARLHTEMERCAALAQSERRAGVAGTR